MLKNIKTESIIKDNSFHFIDSQIETIIQLSSQFGCFCDKIILKNGKKFVLKAQNINASLLYPSVYYEGKSLIFMNNKFKNIFPKIHHLENNFFIMDWIDNNNITNSDSEFQLARQLAKIHTIRKSEFGFDYDTPIGSLKQSNKYSASWINFYRENRLQMILDIINNSNPLPKEINKGIQKIIDGLEKYIPESKTASLIHGDLWSGNILFNNGRLVGLIDPSICFANKEMDLASLHFLKVVSKDFISKYKNFINIEKNFEDRSGIYELYYSLLNVHLWSRDYISETNKLVKKYI